MFVILWEFEVKQGSEERFENAYSPTGTWGKLFQRDSHYRGTRLLRDFSRPFHYFTLDFWGFETACRDFLNRYESAYLELDRSWTELTVREQHVFSCVPVGPVVL